jgi:hypothetical protein
MFIAMRQQVTRRPVLFVAVLLFTAVLAGVLFGATLADTAHLHAAAHLGSDTTAAGQVVSTLMLLLGLLSLTRLALVLPLRWAVLDDRRRPPDDAGGDFRPPAGPSLQRLCRIQV